jgi:tetrahydromethanopterin S-methyltransferase subunit C
MSIKVEVIEGGIPHNNILMTGLLGTLVCLYLTYLNVLTNSEMFSFFGGLAAIIALIWGSHTIKVLCSYGIGTGVPSAGMIAFGYQIRYPRSHCRSCSCSRYRFHSRVYFK